MNSTPRVDRARQCDGKVPHADRRAARVARQQIGHRDAAGHLTIYRCPWCDRFHVGHAWSDPYLADMAGRAAARQSPELELELEAARAVAAALGVPVDEALEYIAEPDPSRLQTFDGSPELELGWLDEVHHLTARQLEELTPLGAIDGIMFTTTATVEEDTDGQ